MDEELVFDVISTAALSFSSDFMSFLDTLSPPLSPTFTSPESIDNEVEDQPNSKRDQRFKGEGSESSVVVTAAMMAGSAVVMASKPRTKNRISGIHTPLFTSPISFKTISEFCGEGMFRKSYRMSPSTFQLLLDTVKDLVEL